MFNCFRDCFSFFSPKEINFIQEQQKHLVVKIRSCLKLCHVKTIYIKFKRKNEVIFVSAYTHFSSLSYKEIKFTVLVIFICMLCVTRN